MSKPRSKSEGRWLMELWELAFVFHGRQRRAYIKRQLNRSIRRDARRQSQQHRAIEEPS